MAFEDFLLVYPDGVPDGTIALTEDGSDWQGVAGAERVAQHTATRLRYRKGEWLFDTTAGPDWFGKILVKNPRSSEVSAEFAGQIIQVPDIVAIISLEVDVDDASRQADIAFSAQSSQGFVSGTLTGP